jgi:hypothetical protein
MIVFQKQVLNAVGQRSDNALRGNILRIKQCAVCLWLVVLHKLHQCNIDGANKKSEFFQKKF